MKTRRHLAALILAALLSAAVQAQDIAFTARQAAAGEALYKEHCAICHGTTLANGQFGTPLRGGFFRNNWKGKKLGELVKFTWESMPPENVRMLAPERYAEAIAFILQANGLEAGETEMAGDLEVLNGIPLPW